MSLKSFHVFFIIVSILLALGFGVWAVRTQGAVQSGLIHAMGAASLAIGVALVVYLALFLRKLKRIDKT
jgi:hypothetical protein